MAARERFEMLISREGLELIDQRRGAWSRAEFIRRAISLAVKQGLQGPDPDKVLPHI